MTTLQEWLNEKYPTKEDKEKVEKIDSYLINKELKGRGIIEKLDGGELDLREYINLKEIYISNYHLTSLITKLEISNCINLVKLDCSDNQLTSLDVSNCPKLKFIDVRDNKLTSLDLSDNIFLTYLNCDYQEEINQEINQLKEELQIEREEITKFQQKSEEWSKRQLKELREEKDKEIAELKEKLVQLVNQQKKQTEEKNINTENQELREQLNKLMIKKK